MSRKGAFLRGLAVERFKKSDNGLHEVIPGLFLGSCGAAYNSDGITSCGVSHILCVANNLIDGIKKAHRDRDDLDFLEISIEDKPGCTITDHFPTCFDYISSCLKANRGVLVHCFQGKSRSSSVIIGYLMQTRGLTFEESLQFVKSKRPVVAPNIGFALQLRKFERKLKDATTLSAPTCARSAQDEETPAPTASPTLDELSSE